MTQDGCAYGKDAGSPWTLPCMELGYAIDHVQDPGPIPEVTVIAYLLHARSIIKERSRLDPVG